MGIVTDADIVDWLCDHATFIIVINDDGMEDALKVCGEDVCARDILASKVQHD